tara:strand:+ start:1001 stop:1132 length:132 start_codon:yes stop_codon:yes gene_type:complete
MNITESKIDYLECRVEALEKALEKTRARLNEYIFKEIKYDREM